MKKICLALAIVMLAAVALAGCGGSASSAASQVAEAVSEAEQAVESTVAAVESEAAAALSEAKDDVENALDFSDVKTVNEGKLVMATEATFPPYEYMQGTDVAGVDVDIAQAIADEMGLELVIDEMPFDSVIASVSTGKADFGASGLSVTPEREEQVDFSIEYATSKQVIMTKADSGITSEADLAGKTVGVQMGTVADLALTDDYPDVSVERYNKYTDAVNDLISGRLDAIVLDSLPAEELKTMGDDLVICDEELFTDVYAICVQKDNTPLLNAINTVLQKLIDEGKIDEFTASHLSS